MPKRLDISDGMRPCRKCFERKPLDCFSIGNRPGRRSFCKPCAKAAQQEYRAKNMAALRIKEIARNKAPGRIRSFRDSMYRKNYGITLDQYEAKYRRQSGACAICQKQNLEGKRLAVDHDHKTGIVRDLLCHSCNVALGYAKDDLKIIAAMFDYIERWSRVVSNA